MDEASISIIGSGNWIHVKQLEGDVYNYSFSSRLHIGEKEAIVLAKETDADLLLVDDRIARSAANSYGIRTVGTIGVIAKAKQAGIIPIASEVIDKLRCNGFFISEEIVRQILENIGEI